MYKPGEYVWILRWGKMMASNSGFIKRQQQKAADDGAPLDATFEKYGEGGGTGEWSTIGDITNQKILTMLGLPPKPATVG